MLLLVQDMHSNLTFNYHDMIRSVFVKLIVSNSSS